MKQTLERERKREKPPVSPNFTSRTVGWVGGAHLVILLGLMLLGFLLKKPEPKLLEMVNLGSANPGNGSAAGSEKGTNAGGNPNPNKNSDGAPPPPAPPHKTVSKPPVKAVKPPEAIKEEAKVEPVPDKVATPPVKTEKIEPEEVKPVEVKKTEPVKPKDTKPVEVKKVEPVVPDKVKVTKPKADPDKTKDEVKKPTKTPVKVEIGPLIKRTTPGTASNKATEKASDAGKEGGVEGGVKDGVKGGTVGSNGTNLDAKGPSASDIKGALSKGLQSVGVVNGSGVGPAGSPDGSAYNALIKRTLTGNWVKPANPGASLKTMVKIRVKPDGTIEAVEISDPSGDKAMDQSVMDAVRSTGKLSKPLPEGLGSPDYVVVVNFQLD